MNKIVLKAKSCQICNHDLISSGRKYSIENILSLWEDMNVKFSDKVINNLISQTNYIELYKCPKCKLGIFYPLLNGTSEFYQELQNSIQYYEDDKWDFHEALKDVEGNQSVIEVGCGPGNFLIKCIEKGINAYGTEYNQEAIRIAENRGITILNENDLKDKGGTFNIVFCFHVLEHVKEPGDFINFLKELVKPGGKICISVPNQAGPLKYIDPCIMNMPPHHLTRWELKTFKEIAKKMDLEIVRIAYEPLLLSNHSYYSYHFFKSFLKSKTKAVNLIQKVLTHYLSMYFNYLLNKKKYKYFKFLRGLTIYIVFQKKE